MGEVSTIGLDIAKSVFQVHGVDDIGAVVIRKRISRAKVLEFFGGLPPCLIGIEACPTAHHWSRELQALGHTVRLMPPSYVKAYLKRSKNDANDAAAICEAVTRPSMRFVPTKSEQQQSGLDVASQPAASGASANDAVECDPRAYGRARHYLGQGPQWHGRAAADHCRAQTDDRIPSIARFCLDVLARQYMAITAEIGAIDKRIHAWHRSCEDSRRLEEIPGIGPIVATALVAEVGDWKAVPLRTQSCSLDRAWCPSSIRPAARSGSAASPSRAIATCDGCWLPAPWPLSDMRGSTAPSGFGSLD